MHSLRTVAASFLCWLLAASCASERRGSDWQITTDSTTNHPHVVNSPPASGAVPTLVANEELRVGSVEGGGPESFGMIRSIAVLPDGRFAIADAQAEEVRVFGPDGEHLRTFGGRGGGPGELQGLQGVHVDHQGLLRVAEQGNARLSVFQPDTGYVTSWPLILFSYSFRGPWAASVDAAGRTFVASSGQYGENRFWSMLRVYDAQMNQLDSIPYDEYTNSDEEDQPGAWKVNLGTNAYTWAQVPFYSRPYQVLTSGGEFWTSAEGMEHLAVTRWVPPGDTSLVLISHRASELVTRAERDSAIDELRARLAQRIPTPPSLDASRVPEVKPPLYGLVLDDRERLWVRLTAPSADSTVYDVFRSDGGHAETVLLPFRIDGYVPPAIRGDTVWAVVTDDLEVQFVVRARLNPPA